MNSCMGEKNTSMTSLLWAHTSQSNWGGKLQECPVLLGAQKFPLLLKCTLCSHLLGPGQNKMLPGPSGEQGVPKGAHPLVLGREGPSATLSPAAAAPRTSAQLSSLCGDPVQHREPSATPVVDPDIQTLIRLDQGRTLQL